MNTRYILFMLMLLLVSKTFFAQEILGGMSWLHSSEGVTLFFSNEGTYELEITGGSDDIPISITISAGKYMVTNNKILLMDNNYGFQMQLFCKKTKLHRKKAKLFVGQSFNWLIGKTFDYWAVPLEYDTPIKTDLINPLLIEQDRENYNNLYTSEFPIKTGIYKEQDGDFRFTLSSDSSYILEWEGYNYKVLPAQNKSDTSLIFEWRDIFISTGTWSRNVNELILYDTGLQHNFYMLIGENKLISKLLPGDYEGVTLYYKE